MHLLALPVILAATCPAGPTGGTVRYEPEARAVSVDVESGSAVMTIVDRLRAPKDAHATLSYNVDIPVESAAIVDASVRAVGGTAVASRQLTPDDEGQFDAYLSALKEGSDAEDETKPWLLTPAPALRVSYSGGFLVEVAGPCALSEIEVTLELLIAGDWREGAWHLPLPGLAPYEAQSLALNGHGDAVVERDGLLVVTPREAVIQGRWAEVNLASEATTLMRARAEVDIPAQLSTLERPLAVTFVVDESVSAGQAQRDASIALIEKMLAQMPRGSAYSVVAFARTPRVAVSPFSPSTTRAALRAIAGRPLRNGSDLARGIAKARGILDDGPDGRDRRLVIISDMLTLDDEITASLKGAPLTHAVHLIDWRSDWTRAFPHDQHLARGVERTGGIWIYAGPTPDDDLALHLVRPTRVDAPSLMAHGIELAQSAGTNNFVHLTESGTEAELPAYLVEGQGVRALLSLPVSDAIATEARPRFLGYVWADPIAIPLEGTARFDLVATATATHDALAHQLSDQQLVELAAETGAVTRLTPREAVPDWRQPPPEPGFGFGMSGCGCGGCGCSGCGGFGTVSSCGGRRNEKLVDGALLLAEWLAKRAGCASAGGTLRVTVGDLEIMEITGQDTCRAEQLWTLRLDLERLAGDQHDRVFGPRRTYTVQLPE